MVSPSLVNKPYRRDDIHPPTVDTFIRDLAKVNEDKLPRELYLFIRIFCMAETSYYWMKDHENKNGFDDEFSWFVSGFTDGLVKEESYKEKWSDVNNTYIVGFNLAIELRKTY